ncbi:hypothetical protein GGR52DRAFT_541728 [Hypoxylon sp. FL1284]|nr:hypothetical protein GGR52DRAFT_541728 [Hypoxylon sp. FL1284]
MAEIAAGALAAEQVVSTGVEAGVAYSVARPTMPLKATFTQIGSTSDSTSRSSLIRSHHTLTIVGDKAYIFGGQTSHGKLANNNVHSVALSTATGTSPEYQVLPAIAAADKDGPVPGPRSKHSACALNGCLAVYGGCDEAGKFIDEGAKIWLYDVAKLSWETLEPANHPERMPPARSDACILAHDGNLVVLGGKYDNGEALADVWHFNCFTKTWNQLPRAPAAITSATVLGDTLYIISHSPDSLSSEVHSLDIKLYAETPPTWETYPVPTNPLTPGPRPRSGGGLVPITTGFGRNYLLYFFGDRQGAAEKDKLQWSDLWTFQLPSSNIEVKATTSFSEAVKPAKIKDQIRSKLGDDSSRSWAEVEVQPPGDLQAPGGKVHPGPRSSFGYDVATDGRSVVMWGGGDAKGEPQGDGWVIKLS